MSDVNEQRDPIELLKCCFCYSDPQNPVVLNCLHSCCQPCFKAAIITETVACRVCGFVTQAGDEQAHDFVGNQLWLDRRKDEPRMCYYSSKTTKCDRQAVACCRVCRLLLCLTCSEFHNIFEKNHVTMPLEQCTSLEVGQENFMCCKLHDRPLDNACISCEQLKCGSCTKECKVKKHVIHAVCDKSFKDYIDHVTETLCSLEKQCCNQSEKILEPQNILCKLNEARDDHLKQLEQRKQLIVNTVESVYKDIPRSMDAMYADLEKRVHDAASAADRTKANFAYAQRYIRKLLNSSSKHGIFQQHKIVRNRLETVSDVFDAVKDTFDTTVIVGSSMPEDLEREVKAWIGTPMLNADPRLPCCPFGGASASLHLTFDCCDIALTKDGSLLLAAELHGLYEYSLGGRPLNHWPAPITSNGRKDSVLAVAALNDGRAAASLLHGQAVVLLRRREDDGSGGPDDAWTVDHCFDQLQWCPGLLSVHGDVVAVGEKQPVNCSRLRLMSVSSVEWLSPELNRQYRIRSLAVAKQMFITASLNETELNGKQKACVLDAHQLAVGDKLKWRLKLCVWDICTDSTGRILYAAVCQSSEKDSRVAAICAETGSELQRVVLSFDGRLVLPRRLSLKDGGVETQSATSSCCLLAALCSDAKVPMQWRTVNAHFSKYR